MNAIWSWFAALLYNYGMFGADMPSVHGGHEPVVPETLQNMVAQHKEQSSIVFEGIPAKGVVPWLSRVGSFSHVYANKMSL